MNRGNGSRRRRGREHVGPAGKAQLLELRVAGGAEAADRTQALGEGADHVVDVLLDAIGLGDAAAVVAEDTQGMGLVDQQFDIVASLHVHELVEWRLVAQHGVDALDDDQLARAVAFQALQALVEVGRRVVAEPDQGGAAQAAAVVDAGMGIGIQQDGVLGSGEAGDDAEVGLIAGREDHGRAAAEEGGDVVFQRAVAGVGAVGDARAGGAGALAADRLDRRLDAVRIEGQPQVVVGADQDDLAPVDDRFGGGDDAVHADVERIPAGGQQAVVACTHLIVFVEETHTAWSLLNCASTTSTRS
jgi:hypothetical protein